MDKLVRDIQQEFASGDRESARLLTEQLQAEQALQLEPTVSGVMQSARTRSCRECEGCCDF